MKPELENLLKNVGTKLVVEREVLTKKTKSCKSRYAQKYYERKLKKLDKNIKDFVKLGEILEREDQNESTDKKLGGEEPPK